jgi:hypothetical protein
MIRAALHQTLCSASSGTVWARMSSHIQVFTWKHMTLIVLMYTSPVYLAVNAKLMGIWKLGKYYICGKGRPLYSEDICNLPSIVFGIQIKWVMTRQTCNMNEGNSTWSCTRLTCILLNILSVCGVIYHSWMNGPCFKFRSHRFDFLAWKPPDTIESLQGSCQFLGAYTTL